MIAALPKHDNGALVGELAEVWCANDERPAIVNRLVKRNGRIELRALCADCNWKLMPPAEGQRR